VPVVPAELLQDDDTSSEIGTAKDAASATITAATASKSSTTTTTDSTTAKASTAAATPEAFQCMVFVERRTTARIVCDLLRMVFRLRPGELCHTYYIVVLLHARRHATTYGVQTASR
jgi:hypothetical protein